MASTLGLSNTLIRLIDKRGTQVLQFSVSNLMSKDRNKSLAFVNLAHLIFIQIVIYENTNSIPTFSDFLLVRLPLT